MTKPRELRGRAQKNPEKAYLNYDFLMSSGARTVRMLSEYYEPQQRFRREGVTATVVFFGSARIISPTEARKNLKECEQLARRARSTSSTNLKLESARMKVQMSRYYTDAQELSFMLTTWFRSIGLGEQFAICSGGGPGIMEAANKGASQAGGKSVGLNISLPFEQGSNRYISKNLKFEFHYFFMRKFWFVYLGRAVVLFPGGFGTMDEMMEVLTLVQTNKLNKRIKVLLYGSKYWQEVLNFEAMVKYGTISRTDLSLFEAVDTPDEAFKALRRSFDLRAWRKRYGRFNSK